MTPERWQKIRELFHAVLELDSSRRARHLVEGKYRVEYPLGKLLYESPGSISSISVSPNGDLLAFEEHPRIPYLDGWLIVMDLNGKKRILSKGWAEVRGAAWSGADEIWFVGERKGEKHAAPSRL